MEHVPSGGKPGGLNEMTMTVSPAADGPCRLDECPPGLFLFEDTLGVKSEYGEAKSLDVFCCDSGEYFWGGTSTREDLCALMVMPMAVVPAGNQTRRK